jgi:dCTP deaminase
MSGFWTTETMKQRLPQLIAPYAEPRVRNCSYELSLGTQVFVTGDDKAKRQITPGTQIVIPPGQFANLLTEETVRVPDDAIGLISMKFTLKQPGLVNVSGFHVDPGYEGKLLFSVYNAGPQSVPITSGTAAFLLWYCALDQATTDLYDKPLRADITDADVKPLGGEVSSPQELARRVKDLENHFKIGAWIVSTVVAAAVALFIGRAIDGGGDGDVNRTRETTSSTVVPSSSPSTTAP